MAGCKPKKFAKGGMSVRKAPKKFADGGMVTPSRSAMDSVVNQAMSSGNLASARGQEIPADVLSRFKAAQDSSGQSKSSLPMTQGSLREQAGFGPMNPTAAGKLGSAIMGGQEIPADALSRFKAAQNPFGQSKSSLPMTQGSLRQQAGFGPMNPTAAGKLGSAIMGGQEMNPTAAGKLGSAIMGGTGKAKPLMMFSKRPAPPMNPNKQASPPEQTASGGRAAPFKKGGMVNAKKKSPASAGKSSSIRPRGSSGKGVKACKVC
jgi:hypothetical protein